MTFLYGAVGAIAVLALVIGGAFAGWKVKSVLDKRPAIKEEKEADEKERKRIKEDMEAFRVLQSYNADIAYGLGGDIDNNERK